MMATPSRRLFAGAAITFAIAACPLLLALGIRAQAIRLFGPPNARLSFISSLEYSARLIWHDGLLTVPVRSPAVERKFTVAPGETVASIADRLSSDGLISSGQAFLDYVIYTGQDTTIQAGDYTIPPELSIVGIARQLQDATPQQVTFVVLPGWRLEEIADSLPTSGLSFGPDEFLAVARMAPAGLSFVPARVTTSEGLLFPDSYLLPRSTTPLELVQRLTHNLALHLDAELLGALERTKLAAYDGIVLASIVEREAVHEDEQGQIASVFLNRLRLGMKLESDPTVQYALGFDHDERTWWTNPLSGGDLEIDSPFNTYLYPGLPPSPIANPGMAAIRAVADAPATPYFYFRARCDGSGYHAFAETFDEHLRNGCN